MTAHGSALSTPTRTCVGPHESKVPVQCEALRPLAQRPMVARARRPAALQGGGGLPAAGVPRTAPW